MTAVLRIDQDRAFTLLALKLNRVYAGLAGAAQYWIGLAGPPGSGKSTLAETLKDRLGERLTVIPMDGYHFYRRELDAMPDPALAHARRGAPFTFNASKFVKDLSNARVTSKGSFPSFDHGVGDPVEDDIRLEPKSQIVLVEGNYLLLDEPPWCELRETVFDETWLLDLPIAECNRRVFLRHLETGLTEAAARRRVETNDSLNAQRVRKESPKNADFILQIRG